MHASRKSVALYGIGLLAGTILIMMFAMVPAAYADHCGPGEEETNVDGVHGCKKRAPTQVPPTATPTFTPTPTSTPTNTPVPTATNTPTMTAAPSLLSLAQMGSLYCEDDSTAVQTVDDLEADLADQLEACGSDRNECADEVKLQQKLLECITTCDQVEQDICMARYNSMSCDPTNVKCHEPYEREAAKLECQQSIGGSDVGDWICNNVAPAWGSTFTWGLWGVAAIMVLSVGWLGNKAMPGAINWLKGAGNSAENWSKGAVKTTGNTAEKAGKSVKSTAEKGAKSVSDTAEKAGKAVKDTAEDAGKSVEKGAKKAGKKIKKLFK